MAKDSKDISTILGVTPTDCWQAWVREIVHDPQMNLDRVMAHVKVHMANHMPAGDASPERWTEWLAGCYNLLAILGGTINIDPAYAVGANMLFRKWMQEPESHTPPPLQIVEHPHQVQRRIIRHVETHNDDYGGNS
jgi:hypothetical protein